jgi:glycosyltransferase involved in cell wall biosynthesis
VAERPLRVLHVSAGNLFGGVETFLVTLARRRSVCPAMEPAFATCFPGRLRDELAAAGVPTHDLGRVRVSRPWSAWRARMALGRLLSVGRFDVAVCHMAWAVGLFGGLAARAGVPLVAYFHGPLSGGWPERLAGRQRPRLVVAPSRHSLTDCRRLFPTDTRAEVLNYPLPAQVTDAPALTPVERAAVRAEFGAGPGDVVILSAVRIEVWKGPDLLVRAVGSLRDTPGWRLWLAGAPQRPHEHALYAECRRLAEAAGVGDRVAFLGQRSDVPRLMRAADLYAQGNRGPEGFSLSFLEAQACGRPVVTTDLGGAGEMVTADTGRLVPAGEDPGPLAAALRDLISDPDRRAAMGATAARRAVELCDPAAQLARLSGWLTATAGERGQRWT